MTEIGLNLRIEELDMSNDWYKCDEVEKNTLIQFLNKTKT